MYFIKPDYSKLAVYLIYSAILLSSCTVSKGIFNHGFSEGYFKMNTTSEKRLPVYLTMDEEQNLSVYRLAATQEKIDTIHHQPLYLPVKSRKTETNIILNKSSFDFDLVTIPFKYRSSVRNFPNQLNTNFNGAFYFGFRKDRYAISYKSNPLKVCPRKIQHVGYSLGAFAGLGTTAMNPWVTEDNVTSEYDGIVLPKGVAAILAFRHATFGFALGVDHLLDRNRKYWIYQGKPWIGIIFGINLN